MDLTEEDIRRYADSLASMPPSAVAELPPAPEPEPLPVPLPAPTRPAERPGPAGVATPDGEKIAEHSVVKPGDPEFLNDPRSVELDRFEQLEAEKQEAEKQRKRLQREAKEQAKLSEEEQLRLEVLSELDRSQMPAVHTEDGRLLKTVEHYTFADSREVATISIELEKDLFEGALALVTEDLIEVETRETDVTIHLRRLPAAKGVSSVLADWRLYLSPLYHTVDPTGTTWKIRKGKVVVRLKKRKAQEWRKVLKF